MQALLERFLRYVRFDTQADESSTTYPSSPGQLEMNRALTEELEQIGLTDVSMDKHGIVVGTVPATVDHETPTVALFAHVDTSPETSGIGVKPIVHENYDGEDITLPGDTSKVIRVSETPDLAKLIGKTIITTDGTTLLGGDDKCGVAAIVEMAARLIADPSIPHGPIRVCFTCDEEIGKGVDHVDVSKIAADVGYTLDGPGTGTIDAETFSADVAVVKVRGINTHPAYGKDKMVNAIRIAGDFLSRLPDHFMSPETTDGRDGFLHPYVIEGGVADVTIRILLRDFETENLAKQAAILESVAVALRADHPKAEIEIETQAQYRNMRDGMDKQPLAVPRAVEAMKRAGFDPEITIIRGGTDGSRLTELGLPTPNLSTGEHNIHSALEWTCLEEMDAAVNVLIELAKVWAEAR